MRRSQSGRDRASSDRIRSCVDDNGEVSYHRTRSQADENGTATRHTSSGNGHCDHDDGGSSSSGNDGDSSDSSDSDSRSSGGDRGSRGNSVGLGGNDALLSVSLGNISLFNPDFGDEDFAGFGDDDDLRAR